MKVFEILYCCAERRSTAEYGRDLSRDVTWCNVTNMSAKNNTESEYYGREECDILFWVVSPRYCTSEYESLVTLIDWESPTTLTINTEPVSADPLGPFIFNLSYQMNSSCPCLDPCISCFWGHLQKKLLYWWNEGLSSSPLQLVLSSTKSSDSLQDITPVRNMPSNHS